MTIRIIACSILSFVVGAIFSLGTPRAVSSVADPAVSSPEVTASNQDDRAADRAAIRAHIESIFQAFIDSAPGRQEQSIANKDVTYVRDRWTLRPRRECTTS